MKYVRDTIPRRRVRAISICGLLAACFCATAQQSSRVTGAEPDSRAGVLTVRYRCAHVPSGVCEAVVTRSEFDALVSALNPQMSMPDRQIFAAEYARLLIMAAEARHRGIDQSASFQTLSKFSALQLLSSELVRVISGSMPLVTSEAEQAYYRDHARDYREVTLSRIFIPAQANHGGQGAAATAARADAVRSRAVNGEDFAALQRETAGVAPDTPQMSIKSCLSLPEALRQVCDLQPGEVSLPLPDGTGFSVFRLESRRDRDLNEVRGDVRATLERLQLQGTLEQVRTPLSLDLDERYFGKLPGPDLAHKHGMQFPASSPTAAEHKGHDHHD